MIALSLPEIKDFMNKLLCTDTFWQLSSKGSRHLGQRHLELRRHDPARFLFIR